jgi:hypothetical protein
VYRPGTLEALGEENQGLGYMVPEAVIWPAPTTGDGPKLSPGAEALFK